MVLALLYSTLLSLVGFYVVRGTVARDFESRVWQLLAATPLSRAGYLLAKWVSHLAVLLLLAGAGLGVGAVAQLARAEDAHLHLWELLKPTLVLSLPALALTATLAVWFDVLPALRRTAGNVLYFFVWLGLIMGPVVGLMSSQGANSGWVRDAGGLTVFWQSVQQAGIPGLGPGGRDLTGLSIGSSAPSGETLHLFAWPAWSVPAGAWAGWAGWLLLSGLAVLLAGPLLYWAAGRAPAAPTAATQQAGRRLRWLEILLAPWQRSAGGALVAAELRLTLRARRGWWWLALAAALGAQAAGPDPRVVDLGLLGAWVLLLDQLGHLALRDTETRTAAFVQSAVGGGRRVVLARTLSNLLLIWTLTLPGLLHLLLAGQPVAALAGALVGLSLPAWGLALGALTGSARPFELLVVVLAYAAVQGVPVLAVVPEAGFTAGLHALLLPGAALLWHLAGARPLAPGG